MTKKSSISLHLRGCNQQMKNGKLGLGKKSDYGRCAVASCFLVSKAVLIGDIIFWIYQTVQLVLTLAITDLLIISTLLMIIYQKPHSVNILCKWQLSSQQYQYLSSHPSSLFDFFFFLPIPSTYEMLSRRIQNVRYILSKQNCDTPRHKVPH